MFGRGYDEGNRSKQLTHCLIIHILIVWETVLAYMTTVTLRKGVDSLTVVRNPSPVRVNGLNWILAKLLPG